jgi:ArsR family transcriptional regulator
MDVLEVEMRELVEIFKALSDETRIQIMGMLLLKGELCVCDVEGALGITQSKSSRHLRILLNAGLVTNRREGVWMHYRILDEQKKSNQIITKALGEMLVEKNIIEELKAKIDIWFEKKGEKQKDCEAC